MGGPSREWMVPLLSGAAGFAALATSLTFRDEIQMPRTVARAIGFALVFVGTALFLWAGYHLESAMRGQITPRLRRLVIGGPFRVIRHPTYAAMVIALFGVSISTRSAVGLAATLLIFLPVEIHRARLEERALNEAFGEGWKAYAARTGFFFPRVRGGARAGNDASAV